MLFSSCAEIRSDFSNFVPPDRKNLPTKRVTYFFFVTCAMLGGDCTFAVETPERGQTGPQGSVGPRESDRRIRCPRASICLQCLASSQPFPLAAASRKKNTWLWIRSPLPRSPFTPASTSNLSPGRAFGSVPHSRPRRAASHRPLPRALIEGGPVC